MPTYRFLNKNTDEIFEKFMSISELEEYLKNNEEIKQLVNGAPLLASGRGMKKPDEGFRDILREMKKNHSKGFTKSTINTF
jgi:endonuclease IV